MTSSSSSSSTLTLWTEAVEAFDRQDFDVAVMKLMEIENPSIYIAYNLGVVFYHKNLFDESFRRLKETVEKDKCFAIGYFRTGCLLFKRKLYDEANQYFDKCEKCFRGGRIDYALLGLKCRLVLYQVLYNSALCHCLMRNRLKAVELLERAWNDTERKPDDIKQLLMSLQNTSISDFQHFDLLNPHGEELFRPTKQPAKKIDWLGSAQVIASLDPEDKHIGFSALQRKSTGNDNNEALAENNEITNVSVTRSEVNLKELVIPRSPTYPPPRCLNLQHSACSQLRNELN